jgi:type II secretion system protein H
MSPKERRTGFTLLELMLVAALLAIAVGVATLNVHGMTDQARLQVTASQIGAVYRLAMCEAARSGRPRVLTFDRHGCAVKKPVYNEGQWAWSLAPQFELVSGVSVVKVLECGSEHKHTTRSPRDVVITPGALNSDRCLELRLDSGSRGTVKLDGMTGMTQVRLVHDERR